MPASQFIKTPKIRLPSGRVFEQQVVGKYLNGEGANGALCISTAEAAPRVNISYREACVASKESGMLLMTESLRVALAYDASLQDINWTGGKVGKGKMFQGLHKGTVRGAQAATFESDDPEERRWLELSNGERIWDLSGNVYEYVFDDVQGDEEGLVARPFADDSISISLAPEPCMTKGVGWYPEAGDDWSRNALIRGGCWRSGGDAGAFGLSVESPGSRYDDIGFRCTKP